jgi:hypothetical protein
MPKIMNKTTCVILALAACTLLLIGWRNRRRTK